MRNARIIAGIVALTAPGVLFAAPAQAADRFDVVLADAQSFEDVPGTFTSNIPGCPTGVSTTERAMVQFRPGVFRGTRTFTCDSGIGSVTVNLSARFGEGGSVGTWAIAGGTGAFSDVHGAGRLVGTPLTEGILDTYTGTVTVVV
jgi:hypothetical protein